MRQTEFSFDPEEALEHPPAPDQQLRDRALDPKGSFIVKAPAGSGKTEVLTQRILALLAVVDRPEEILAITFTRKAAAEMAERVMQALNDAAGSPQPKGEGATDPVRHALATRALQRDRDRQWHLLHDPGRLRVSTIDSLNVELARGLPLGSTLGGPAVPSEDVESLFRRSARRLLLEDVERHKAVLNAQSNDFAKVIKLIATMLATRDQWLRHVLDERAPGEIRDELEASIGAMIEQRLQTLETLLNSERHPVLASIVEALPRLALQGAACRLMFDAVGEPAPRLSPERKAEMQAGLRALKPQFAGAEDELCGCVEHPGTVEWPARVAARVAAWRLLADTILNQDKLASRLNRGHGFPVSNDDADLLQFDLAGMKTRKGEIQAMLNALNSLVDASASEDQRALYVELTDAFLEVRALPEPHYSDAQWQLLESLFMLLRDALPYLYDEFQRHGVVDFVEMGRRALQALGRDDAPTDLALQFDYRIRHILVDEFQDTSLSQFALFSRLIAGWTEADGNTFFAVGDPMQSIYRFREAEVALFNQAWHQGIGPLRLTPLELRANFRSSPAIVDWVNDTFAGLMGEQATAPGGGVPYSPSLAARDIPGQVQWHLSVDADAAAEAAAMVETMQALLERHRDNREYRIAILVRSRKHAEAVVRAMEAAGIAWLSLDMELLGERIVVRDIRALQRVLCFPHDQLHWAAVLRAPWCGLTLAQLHALFSDSRPMSDKLREPRSLAALDQDGRERLQRIAEVLLPALDGVRQDRVMPWVQSVWMQLGGPLICSSASDRLAVVRAIETLSTLEEQGNLYDSLAVDAVFARLYANPPDDAEARVRLMTIHKSKGLQFDAVLLPALAKGAGRDASRLIDHVEVTDLGEAGEKRAGTGQLLLAPLAESGSADSSRRLNTLVKSIRKRADDEELKRLLYVACTRAISELHLFATLSGAESKEGELVVRPPRRGSLLQLLWAQVQSERVLEPGTDVAPSEPGAQEAAPPPPLMRLRADALPPAPPAWAWPEGHQMRPAGGAEAATPLEFNWAGVTARQVGTLVHRQIQRLAGDEAALNAALNAPESLAELQPRILRQLAQLGVPPEDSDAAAAKVLRALQQLFTDAAGRRLFAPTHRERHSERALAGIDQGRVRRFIVDLSFIDADGTLWIVDFKTGEHQGGGLEHFLEAEQARYYDQLKTYADIMKRMKGNEQRSIRTALYFPLIPAFREGPGA